MEKTAAIFISLIVVISTVLAGLGYLYFTDGQEAYTGISDDGGTSDTTPDTTPDTSNLPLAPDFNLPKVGGGYVKLSSLRGQIVVLDFMATWCGPCETELAHLDEVYNSYSSNQVRILSIDVDATEGESLLSQYKNDHGIAWDILMDTSGTNDDAGYDVTSIPTIVIVDQDGRIAYRAVGITEASILKAEINALL